MDDVIRFGLWTYLFSEQTQQNENMMMLADHILGLIADDCPVDKEHPAGLRLNPREINPGIETPASFADLEAFLKAALANQTHPVRSGGVFAFGTCRALLVRLGLVLGREGRPIFSPDRGPGRPLEVVADRTTDPLVIDVATLPTDLRRFVVAAVLDQVKTHQLGDQRVPGQVYLLVLDELGIYAPRGGRDPITRLFEHVAAQLRSQGVILLSAQQQASKVSETIFGNSEIKAIGASSPVELNASTWRDLLSSGQKARALALRPEEKQVQAPRAWTTVRVPFPAWAMKETEADFPAMVGAATSTDGLGSVDSTQSIVLRLPES